MKWIVSENEWIEKRREARKKIRISAVAYDPRSKLRVPVTITDISRGGAAIRCLECDSIPDEFILLLANNEQMRRHCIVVRRTAKELGVMFRYR